MGGRFLKYIILLLFLITLYMSFYLPREGFETRKKLYLVWDSKSDGGFGDKLRGAIAAYQLCKKNNYEFILDGTDNTCGHFLKNIKSESIDIIRTQQPVNIMYDAPNKNFLYLETRVRELMSKSDSIFIDTNLCPANDNCISYKANILTDDEKLFARRVCEPTDELGAEVDQKIKSLPENYGIQHFRFKDDVFSNDINISNPIFMKCFNILKKKYKPTDVLLSNSNNFKQYAKENLHITTVECNDTLCKVEHIGLSNDYDSLKNSFVEFFVVTRAKYIISKSQYPWVSGFIKWPALIYDIPLESLN